MGKHDLPKLPVGERVKDKYEVEEILGSGAFGAVYRVRCLKTDELYAMKTESSSEKIRILKVEAQVLKVLNEKVQSSHTCRIVDRGHNQDYTWVFVVMTLVGPSLQKLRRDAGGRFSMQTALRVGRQCLEGVRDVHKAGYLHRDIKPANFAIGRRESNEHRTVFILDFGLCRAYLNEQGELRSPRDSAGFRGTVRYASLSTHKAVDMGRKDDIESWLYLLIEFVAGRLPWSCYSEKQKVLDKKEVSRKDGSLLRHCPNIIKHILEYTDNLAYWDCPDYDYYLKLIQIELSEHSSLDSAPKSYDWEAPM